MMAGMDVSHASMAALILVFPFANLSVQANKHSL